jgi:hypothetical protein
MRGTLLLPPPFWKGLFRRVLAFRERNRGVMRRMSGEFRPISACAGLLDANPFKLVTATRK